MIKNRISQEPVQSLLHQGILSFQVRAAVAVVLDLQSQRVEERITLRIVDAAARVECLGDVKETLLGLEEPVRLLCRASAFVLRAH